MESAQSNIRLIQYNETYYKKTLDKILSDFTNDHPGWSRTLLIVFRNLEIQNCLYPGYSGIEIGSWSDLWNKPFELKDCTSLVRLNVGEPNTKDKLTRLSTLGQILKDAGSTLIIDEQRCTIIADKSSLPRVFASLTKPIKNYDQILKEIASLDFVTDTEMIISHFAEIKEKYSDNVLFLTQDYGDRCTFKGILLLKIQDQWTIKLCPGNGYNHFTIDQLNDMMTESIQTLLKIKDPTIFPTSFSTIAGRHSGDTIENLKTWKNKHKS